jgi:hypothetical protein
LAVIVSTARSRAETINSRPSGSQSIENGNEGTRAISSLSPSGSTAISCSAPQSVNHNRPSCQRGHSPNEIPVISVCSSDMGERGWSWFVVAFATSKLDGTVPIKNGTV